MLAPAPHTHKHTETSKLTSVQNEVEKHTQHKHLQHDADANFELEGLEDGNP